MIFSLLGSPCFHVGCCHRCAAHLLLLHLSPSVSLRLFLSQPPVQWFHRPLLSLSVVLTVVLCVSSDPSAPNHLPVSFSPDLYLHLPCLPLDFFPFLLPICPPFLCLSHSVSVRSERSFPALRGVRGDKQFSVLLFTFSSDWAKCVCASICVCVYSVQKRERQCYLAGIGPGCCVTTH